MRLTPIGLALGLATLAGAARAGDADYRWSTYLTERQCAAAGNPAELCRQAWQRSEARARETRTLYVAMPLCEMRYGIGHCEGEDALVAPGDRRTVYGSTPVGMALLRDPRSAKAEFLTQEPVYACPQEWAQAPLCYQSVTGTIFTDRASDRPVSATAYDTAFRNPLREILPEQRGQDLPVGHRLIRYRYGLWGFVSTLPLRESLDRATRRSALSPYLDQEPDLQVNAQGGTVRAVGTWLLQTTMTMVP